MRRAPRQDLFAGLTVAIAALPLSIGFGVASGLGARAGLVTAVLAGGLAALTGGARLQITGPSGVVAVVLAPIAHVHGRSGVLLTGLLAGIVLLVLSLVRADRYLRCVPAPVVKGFVVGAAAVIVAQQIPAALGRTVAHGEAVAVTAAGAVVDFFRNPDWPAFAITLATFALSLIGTRFKPAIPFPLLAVAAATAFARITHLRLARIGQLPTGVPAPTLDFLAPSKALGLLPAALTLAAVIALESLMTAAAADSMKGSERHDGQRVLFGQSLANLAVPCFGGVAATGTVCRTAINVRSGAASQLAALTNAAVLAVILLAAAPLVTAVPLAALAGVLIATAVRMIDLGSLRALGRIGRGQAAIAALTAALTLAVNLVTAVITGIVLAMILALRTLTATAHIEHVSVPAQRTPLPEGTPPSPHAAQEQIAVHYVAGPLLFSTADRVLRSAMVPSQARTVILDLSRVTELDTTAILTLADVIEHQQQRGAVIQLSGVCDTHRLHLDALGVLAKLPPPGSPFATAAEAIAQARAQLASLAPQPQDESFPHPHS
ncbi:SulP family inorganic anion transporter [Streptomyces noursei]|uniref:SulP family inorganic anion transporter n=1 Tax=Streptomyces noursei TaxID=1971 RepID=UPI0033D354B6